MNLSQEQFQKYSTYLQCQEKLKDKALQQTLKSQNRVSEYLQLYKSYLYSPNHEKYCQTKSEYFLRQLSYRGIDYNSHFKICNKNKQINEIQWIPEIEFNYSQIVIFKIKIMPFQIKLTLLNIKGKNPFLQLYQFKRGNYGKVFNFFFLSQVVAIKVFTYSEDENMSSTIKSALKQYAIMKICSILGCAPNLDANFGFDVIAYDDSVMFCMEKCQQMKQLKTEDIKSLKLSLGLMHHYKIIHFDIKPENIMHSPHFGRPVFIDFGFSEIIDAEIGQKILIQFRGSPSYCSEQMVKLLGKLGQSKLIDVYYNDMHGLLMIQPQLNKLLSSQDQLQYSTYYDESIQNSLMIGLLKYMLMRKRKDQIIALLRGKDHYLLRNHGNQILNLFKYFLSNTFFETICSELSKQFHKYIEPAFIENYFKFHFQNLLHRYESINDKSYETEHVDFKERICNKQYVQKQLVLEKYLQLLSIKDIYQSAIHEETAKYILLQSLRFDIKNNSLDVKIQLAHNFNLAHGVKSCANFRSIHSAFLYLFQYCIDNKMTTWKKQHHFTIFNQCIMLDLNLQPFFEQYIACLKQMYRQFKDMIKCWLQLTKIVYLHSFKYISDYEHMKEQFPQKIYIFANQFIRTALQNYRYSKDLQIQGIISVIEIFVGLKQLSDQYHYYDQIVESLKLCKDIDLKREICQFLYLQILQFYYGQQMYTQANNLLNLAKEFTFFHIFHRKQNVFHYSAFYVYQILVLSKNNKQIVIFLDNIIKCFNCIEVSSKFKFEMAKFLYSQEQDSQKLCKYAKQMIQCPNSLITVRFRFQFSEIIQKIKHDAIFVQTYPPVIQKMAQLFMFLEQRLVGSKEELIVRQIQRIMYTYNIINFFIAVSPQACKKHINKMIDYLHKKMQINKWSNIKHLYYSFQINIYLSLDCSMNQLRQKTLNIYEQLYQIGKQIQNPKIIYYFLKKIISYSIVINAQDKLLQYTIIFYNLEKTIPSFTRYFQVMGKKYITITLYEFYMTKNIEEFYNFLIILSRFITIYPSQQYIQEWTVNIKNLMKIDKILNIINYESLSMKLKHVYWDNHYFVYYYIYSLQIQTDPRIKREIFMKIAQNIGFLAIHAKEAILSKYFYFIIDYFQSTKRMKNYLIAKWGYKYLTKHQVIKFFKNEMMRLKKHNKGKALMAKIMAASY